MCRFISFCFFFLCFSCVLLRADAIEQEQEFETYSRRIAVQDHIDECIGIVYKIRSGDIEQEEGLEHLEDMLDLLKFITWYWVED